MDLIETPSRVLMERVGTFVRPGEKVIVLVLAAITDLIGHAAGY